MLPTVDTAFRSAPIWPDVLIGFVLGLVLGAVIIAYWRMK